MKKIIGVIGFLCFTTMVFAQNNTEVSLYMKKVKPLQQLGEVNSKTGDMYKTLGHHGPAIENEFYALRLYFNYKAAIDVYSKTKPGMELLEAKWYTTPEQQKEGWGADYYKVGETIGLGGIRLWDGKEVVNLNPVSKRSAKVVKEGTISYMEMLSEDVPYKDRLVDVLVRVTVYSGIREAKVEAMVLDDEEVQFVTGINYFDSQQTAWAEDHFITWGEHPEDVAIEKVAIGGALLFDPNDFKNNIDDGTQNLIISKSCRKLSYWVTSANAKERELNSFKKFNNYVKATPQKKKSIDECINQFKKEESEDTKSGYRYWFVDKNFVDGRTIKMNVVKPGQATHPPHIHEQDEFFYILEGLATFHLNGEQRFVGPFTSLYCPPFQSHGISNSGDTDLKYLVIKKY